jgi:hypothetical protein
MAIALSVPSAAHAQLRFARRLHHPTSHFDIPKLETGVSLGLWNLNGGSWIVNGHLSNNLKSWFAVEGAGELGRSDDTTPRYGLAIVDARLSAPAVHGGPTVFVLAGGAVGNGLTWTGSPIVGVGVESRWGPAAAVRVELQAFPSGHPLRDHERILIGIAIRLR